MQDSLVSFVQQRAYCKTANIKILGDFAKGEKMSFTVRKKRYILRTEFREAVI